LKNAVKIGGSFLFMFVSMIFNSIFHKALKDGIIKWGLITKNINNPRMIGNWTF